MEQQIKVLVEALPFIVVVVSILIFIEMEDLYSKLLVVTMSSLIVYGLMVLTSGLFIWGIIMLTLGVMMISGFKTPKSPPKTIFLMTFFGKPTESVSEGLTMTLTGTWLDVVGTIEVPVKLEEETVTIPEEIRCNNSVPVGGTLSIGFIADLSDDDPRKPNPKTKGQKILAYIKAGGAKSIMETIRGSSIQIVKDIAKDQSPEYMETQSKMIGEKVREELERGITRPGSENLLSLSDFGIDITKLAVILTAPKNVREERSKIAVEEAQRASQVADTETWNKRVRIRISEMYGLRIDSDGNFIDGQPSKIEERPYYDIFLEVRRTLVEDQALNDGKYQVIQNPGGANIVGINQAK